MILCRHRTGRGKRLRSFRRVAAAAGLDAQAWTPRELRHSFVSLLSSTGMSIEDISHLVGHASSRVTELVYRKVLRPVLTRGARAMDALFPHEKAGGLGKQLGKQPSREPRRGRSGSQGCGCDPGVMLVGDTGFEPVTSSVSVLRGPL